MLAGGHAKPYPSEAAPLIARMVEYGAVVSEMPIEWEPRGRDFPRRNRIVSGLALGTVVVEAARGSGSLITARFALEQNRQVFAVPGSPLDPRAEGTNDLLKQGATICTHVDDVLTALAPMRSDDLFASLEEGGEGEPLLGDEADIEAASAPGDDLASDEFADRGVRRRPRPHRRAARSLADHARRACARGGGLGARGARRADGARARRADRVFRRRPGRPPARDGDA